MPVGLTEAVELFGRRDLHEVGLAADALKRKHFGESVSWVNNAHINYTNVCVNDCSFCTYHRNSDDADAYTLTVEQVLEQVSTAVAGGACEVHIVGAVNDRLEVDYYVETVGQLRLRFGDVYIKAFTAVEIDFVAKRCDIDVAELLGRLVDAGLDSLAGGGAEIFSARVRGQVCPEKISGDRWLEIHRIAHGVGLVSNATMLFGHVETLAERAEHLVKLRELQDETGGFQSFLPLPAVDFEGRAMNGIDALRTLAVSRLVLHNFPHIKVFWPIWTVKLAQLALSYGADDFDGTVGKYRIVDSGKLGYEAGVRGDEIRQLIAAGGYNPIERRGDYGPIVDGT